MSSLEELYAGTGIGRSSGTLEPVLDIVAIHGLNPKGSKTHATDTWQDKKSGNLWLRDSIPYAQPNTRIFLYEYNSSPVFGSSQGRFIDEANQFLVCLRLERRKDPKRPLLLLGHSLGGILIKQALVNAFNDPIYRDIQEATYGLVFFGTPHGGPGDGWQITFGKAAVRIAQSLPGRTSNDIMEALRQGSLFSHTLQNQWRHQLDHYQILTFYEGIGDVVPQYSATLGLPGDRESQIKIQAKHGDMCRFNPDITMDKSNYKLVEGNVLELCEKASQLDFSVGQRDKDSAVQMLERHCQNPRQSNLPQAYRASFQWIWDTQNPKLEFANWLRGEGPLFWISGKPGAGKSTLMGYLSESEQTIRLLSENSDAIIIVHYFFHELGEPQEKSFGGLLHAIVYKILISLRNENQATLSRLYKMLQPHLRPSLRSKAALPNRILIKLLQKLVAECEEPLRVCLFIDGFDECQGDHREQLDFLTDWVRSSSNKKLSVRACVASRVETEIELRLSNEPTFAIHHFTEGDISTYVTERLGKAWDLMAQQRNGTTAEHDQDLIDRVVEKAEGVFIWVTLVVSQLVVAIEEEVEAFDLHRLLADLPEGLERLYASIIDKIDQRFWHDTINFLNIFRIHNAGTMTLLEFSAAVQDPMTAISCKAYFDLDFTIDDAGLSHRQCAQVRRRFQRSCRGLIEIEDTEDLPSARVSLLHLSVEEYVTRSQLFEKMLDKVDKKCLRDPNVALMAMYLRLLKIYPGYHHPQYDMPWHNKSWRSLTFRFFYATKAAEYSTGSSQVRYVEKVDRVLSHSEPDWIHLYYEWQTKRAVSLDWNTDLLSLAVYHNLTRYVQQQIKTNGKGIMQKAHGRPLLFYACDSLAMRSRDLDAIDTFKILLNNGADPMETFGLDTVWSFTLMAPGSFSDHRPRNTELFRVMLEHGVDPTQRVFRPDEAFLHQDYNPDFKYWWSEWPEKSYSTVFHITLSFLALRDESPMSILKALVDHCNDFGATDSDGLRIQDWVDTLDPEMGAFLRRETAATKQRKRRRRH